MKFVTFSGSKQKQVINLYIEKSNDDQYLKKKYVVFICAINYKNY